MSFIRNEVLRRSPGAPTLDLSAWGHGYVVDVDCIILESCHSTWIFDTEHREFRRILKGMEVADRPVTTEWPSYSDLHLDPWTETFTVYLNATHTRQIQSWRPHAQL